MMMKVGQVIGVVDLEAHGPVEGATSIPCGRERVAGSHVSVSVAFGPMKAKKKFGRP
jgi:hypothetical protein